jgi:hypothetical protein
MSWRTRAKKSPAVAYDRLTSLLEWQTEGLERRHANQVSIVPGPTRGSEPFNVRSERAQAGVQVNECGPLDQPINNVFVLAGVDP